MYTIKHVNGLNLHHTQCLGSPLYLLLLAYVIHKNTVTLLVLLYLHIVTISSHLLTEWVNHNNDYFFFLIYLYTQHRIVSRLLLSCCNRLRCKYVDVRCNYVGCVDYCFHRCTNV